MQTPNRVIDLDPASYVRISRAVSFPVPERKNIPVRPTRRILTCLAQKLSISCLHVEEAEREKREWIVGWNLLT